MRTPGVLITPFPTRKGCASIDLQPFVVGGKTGGVAYLSKCSYIK